MKNQRKSSACTILIDFQLNFASFGKKLAGGKTTDFWKHKAKEVLDILEFSNVWLV